MTDAELSSAFKLWTIFGVFGCVIVIIGIIGEGFELLLKWWRKRKFRVGFGLRFDNLNRGRLSAFIRRFHKFDLEIETFAIILVVLGLVIEVAASHVAYGISDLQNSLLNKEAGEARKAAGLANERAFTNELQVAILSNETVRLSINLEDAKSNNLVLQKQLQVTRRKQAIETILLRGGITNLEGFNKPISVKNWDVIGNSLKQFEGVHAEMRVIPDSKAWETETNLERSLKEKAEWIVSPPKEPSKIVDGIVVGFGGNKSLIRPAVELVRLLNENGAPACLQDNLLDLPIWKDPSESNLVFPWQQLSADFVAPSNAVLIVIGQQPPPEMAKVMSVISKLNVLKLRYDDLESQKLKAQYSKDLNDEARLKALREISSHELFLVDREYDLLREYDRSVFIHLFKLEME